MELLRRTVRSFLRSDTKLYKMGAVFLDFLFTTRKEGIGCWHKFRELGKELKIVHRSL